MNHIFKTVWNALRRCLVVVNEAVKATAQSTKKGAIVGVSMAVSTVSPALAEDYIFDDPFQTYEMGIITNANDIRVYGTTATFESINSPSAVFASNFKWAIDPPETADWPKLSESDFYWGSLTINGDTVVESLNISATNTRLNGNVTVHGSVSADTVYSAVNDKWGTLKSVDPGMFLSGSNKYYTGGVVVKGNVTASYIQNIGGIWWGPERIGDTCADLIIEGNVSADWLVNDTLTSYDNTSDHVDLRGITTIKNDVFNNGYLDANKLIVHGVFYNGFGEYIETGYDPSEFPLTPGETTGANIVELDAKNIFNASNLYVKTLSNTVSQTYNQSFGTIQVETNWFTNSTINLSGGIIDEAYLGQAHNLGVNNTYNVTGGVLKVGDLRGDSTIHLSDEGKLETQLDSVFENYAGIANAEGLNTVSLSSAVPESIRNTVTDLFRVYVPGTVIDNVMERVTLNGGQIVISGVDITATQRDDLMAAFKETF